LAGDVGDFAVRINALLAEKTFKNDMRRIGGKTDADLFSSQLIDIF